eukprot:7951440-Prorocentrum_lima.AAC.1
MGNSHQASYGHSSTLKFGKDVRGAMTTPVQSDTSNPSLCVTIIATSIMHVHWDIWHCTMLYARLSGVYMRRVKKRASAEQNGPQRV